MPRVPPLALAKATALVFAATAAPPSPAAAQSATVPGDAADAIIVTARKVAEPLIDAPLSVTSVGRATIENAGLRTVYDAIGFAPNVEIGGGLAGELQGQVAIRGISTLVRNIGLETGVGMYVDGVFVGRPESFAQHLLDVDRVEILRGPQGTEYGKNTIAGVIGVHTRAPDAPAGGYLEMSGGTYATLREEAAYGGPITDTLSARAAIAYADQNGFTKHLSGDDDAGSLGQLTWRVAAKLAASGALAFTVRGDGARERGTPDFFQADALAGYPPTFRSMRPHRVNNNRPDRLSRDNAGASLTADWTGTDLALVSITAYRHSSYKAQLDDDQEQVDFVAADAFGDRSRLFTQELRLSGNAGKLGYLLGGYYFDQRVATDRVLALGADLGVPGEPALSTRGAVRTRSRALFARLDYQVAPRLRLSAGVRYTDERKRARFTQDDPSGIFPYLGFPDLRFVGAAHDHDVSPSASATFTLANGVNLYGHFAQGFKSAAFNVDIATSLDGLTARPEKATSYEAGIKLALLDNRLQGSLAAFRADYDRLQVSQVLGNGIALDNAGKARSQGLEAELWYRVAVGLRLEASGGLLDAKYTRFANCGVPLSLGGGVTDCGGNDLVLAPHASGRVAVQYDWRSRFGALFARADVDSRSSIFFEPTNAPQFKSGGRTVIDLRAGLRRGRWEVDAWVRNLADTTYKTYSDDRSGLGVLRTAAYGPPRTVGATLRAGL